MTEEVALDPYQHTLDLIDQVRVECSKMRIPSPDPQARAAGAMSSVYLLHSQLWASVKAAVMAHREMTLQMERDNPQKLVMPGTSRADRRRKGK